MEITRDNIYCLPLSLSFLNSFMKDLDIVKNPQYIFLIYPLIYSATI